LPEEIKAAAVRNLLRLELREGSAVHWTAVYDGRKHCGVVHIGADVGRLYASTMAIIQEHDIQRVSLSTPIHGLQNHRAVIMLAIMRCQCTRETVNSRNKKRRSFESDAG
jgi:hypothetical protein